MLHCVHCLKVEWKSDTHLGSFSLHLIFYFLRPSPLYCLQTRLTFHGTTGVLRNNSFGLTTLFLSSTNILLFQLMLLNTYLVPGFLLKSLHLSVPLIFPRTCNDGITTSNTQLIQGHTANGYIGYGNSNPGFFFFFGCAGSSCASDKEPVCQCRRHKRHGFNSWIRKSPWRRKWQPTPVFLPGEFHGQKNLAGYSP